MNAPMMITTFTIDDDKAGNILVATNDTKMM